MSQYQISGMKFAKVYPLYVQKAERKNRTATRVKTAVTVSNKWLIV